jgi:hypothetical protein
MSAAKHLLFAIALAAASEASADCPLLHSSDALPPQGAQPSPAQSLNEIFPNTLPGGIPPWRQTDFKTNPHQYAEIIKALAKASIRIQGSKIQIDQQQWWSAPFMNYTNNGREHFNGLTKERSPRAGDLAPNSPAGSQVWAVGWYNMAGAVQVGKIWRDRCQPDEAAARLFPEHTLSVKMLFTNASPTHVLYLQGSPEVQAAIDPNLAGGPPSQRIAGSLRLLQVDFAVKDNRATSTGWVFGTFAWMAPRVGDGVWDNLQLVGLHWGNDPGKRSSFQEGYVNANLQGKLFGWPARPFMGFEGRVNGPADNLSSACLSCHARAQTPRAQGGLAGNLPDLANNSAVKAHLDRYFQNVPAGSLASPVPNAIPLDYSLQVMNAWERQCAACAAGDVAGAAPRICRLIPATQGITQCAGGAMEAFRTLSTRPLLRALIEGPPARQ